jgi:hypothetical protein
MKVGAMRDQKLELRNLQNDWTDLSTYKGKEKKLNGRKKRKKIPFLQQAGWPSAVEVAPTKDVGPCVRG